MMNHKKAVSCKLLLVFICILTITSCEKKDDGVDTSPPGKVVDLSATSGNGQVMLSWTEPSDADLDRIEISHTPGSDMVYSQTSGLNSITITGLINGTAYEFAVRTVDENGNKSDTVQIMAVPNTPFVVVEPDQSNYNPAGETFSTDGSGHLIISVTFNRAVDINSVVAAKTIYFEGDAVSAGTVTFSNDKKTVTFTTTDLVSDFATYSQNIYFDFLLIGDEVGNGIIRDANGMLLDGDENGQEGGNFILNLYIIG